jgi:uncharacterized protein (TIGR02453 family)
VAKQHFSPAVFTFLTELSQHNEKAWWDSNKQRYVEVIREPALDFIQDFGPRLARISPHFTADSRAVGGSLMRPYRDTRFSNDKTPYKTNVGIQFRHDVGKDIHAPGFYVHLEPKACFVGVGMWHPETPVARQIRQAINDDPAGWKKAAKGKAFANVWSIEQDEDETLKRVPRELDQDHPYADDLRMKSFIAGTRVDDQQVTSPGFDSDLAAKFAKAGDFTAFICAAIGLPF